MSEGAYEFKYHGARPVHLIITMVQVAVCAMCHCLVSPGAPAAKEEAEVSPLHPKP
jgi:cytochrome c5